MTKPFRTISIASLHLVLLLAGVTAAGVACSQGTGERMDPVSQGPGPSGEQPDPNRVPTPVPPSSTDVDTLPDTAPEGTPVARHGQLSVQGGQLVDASGNPVTLEGVSSMWLNWESGYGRSLEGLIWMRDNWNVEVIRAAMGVEPDNAYLANPGVALQQLESVVQNAITAGVYVIIDWHDHAAHLHQADAEMFFASMATTWGGYPNVLYETYNEPTPPSTWTDIKPYHEAVLAAIRANDPDGIVILGTPNWSQRPDVAALDPVAGDNLMYTLHFYSCEHGATIRNYGQIALDAGHAVFVTEWGATTADGGLPETGATLCLDEAQAWHDWMQTENISWTAWKLEACDDASCMFLPGAPIQGGFTSDWLQGHGPFVVDRLLD